MVTTVNPGGVGGAVQGPPNPTNTNTPNPRGVEVNALDLATVYLNALNAPATVENQRALAAWFLAESPHGSKPNTIVMYGNNPLNIVGRGDAGTHTFTKNPYAFASYSSVDTGAKQWADNLQSGWGATYGYNHIANALQQNNQQGFIAALGSSKWGTNASLVQSVFNRLTGSNATGPGTTPGAFDWSTYDKIINDIGAQEKGAYGTKTAGQLNVTINGQQMTLASFLGIDPNTPWSSSLQNQIRDKLISGLGGGTVNPSSSGPQGPTIPTLISGIETKVGWTLLAVGGFGLIAMGLFLMGKDITRGGGGTVVGYVR